ncbi:MAG: metal-dependent transcriptional regulator [Clostridia bacterium]|nr:metal-dependent transcriptional regulator [Clostridia bacterium]
MELHRAGMEYLKTILILEQQNGSVRSLDVVRTLNVTKPSVSKAMKHLREGGYLSMEGDKRIRLTKAGRQIAEQALEKHRILTNCLLSMGVDPVVAERDARQMEHSISAESLERMQRFVGGKSSQEPS